LKRILKYLDDLLFLTGIASLTYAGFLYHEIAGFVVLGVGLVAYSILIARGGDGT
jgi:hypothetical protein